MQFKKTTIVPQGRYEYGQYLASGNVSNKVTSVIYGGNNTTTGGGGGGGNLGGNEGDVTDNNFNMYLSQTNGDFDGALVAIAPQTASTRVVGFKGQEQMETYIGVIDQHTTASEIGGEIIYNPPLPANYGITGVTQGMAVVVTDNATTGTTLIVSIDNTCTASTGTLLIPCNISMNAMQDLEDNILDWVKAHDEGKTMSVVLEYTWVKSAQAETAYRLDLSNDAGSINCDDDGNVLTGATRPSCQAAVYFGNDPYTAATYDVDYNDTQNVTGFGWHTSNGVLYIDYDSPTYFNFTGDHLNVLITGKVGGQAVAWKTFTITKSMPSEGHPATSYWMVFNSSSVKVNPNTIPATVTPTAITAEVMMQVGQDTPTAATGCSIYYGYTDTPATSYPSTGVTVNVSEEAVYFVAKKGNAIVDGVEQIPILKDGLKGEAGQSAYHLDLNNQSASINCDSSGNILTGAIRPTCKAQLYHGKSACTGVTYSIVSANCSYTGVTVQPTGATSAATITFAPGTASTPFWFDTSYTCLELTIEARIGGALYGSAIMSVSRSIAGADGRSITGVTEWYALNNNQSTAPTSGWTTGITNPTSATPFLWNYEEIHYNAGSATTTSPVIIARYTKDGKGISAITEFYAINNSSTTPPTSWSNTMEVPTDSKPYLWNKEEILYTDGSIDYTDPVIIGIKGSNGQAAVSYWLELSADEVKLTTANTFTPATITASAWKQIGENTPTGATDATILWDYDTTTPTSPYTSTITVTGTSHNYITFRLMVGNVQRDIETVLILRDGKDGTGTQGRQGAAIRGPIDWYDGASQSGRRWCNGQLTDNSHPEDAMWIDVIIKDGTYYYCDTSYTEQGLDWTAGTPTVESHWTSADTEFDFVATNLLLANNAKIKFLTNQEIYLMDSTGEHINAGMSGGSGHTDSTINLWVGNENPGDAPFQVSYDGTMRATAGVFSGYIQMKYNFVNLLPIDYQISASSVTERYLSQTNFLGVMQEDPPASASTSGDCYFNTRLGSTSIFTTGGTDITGVYRVFRTSWVTANNCKNGNVKISRGYMATNQAYLVSDGYTYGATLVLPAPTSDLNGFVYDMIVESNIATRSPSTEFPGLKVINAYYGQDRDEEDFYPYCFFTGNFGEIDRVILYGGRARFVCIPKRFQGGLKYVWAITDATGGFELYKDATFKGAYSPIHGYTGDNGESPIYRINAYRTDPGDHQNDTLYVSRQ